MPYTQPFTLHITFLLVLFRRCGIHYGLPSSLPLLTSLHHLGIRLDIILVPWYLHASMESFLTSNNGLTSLASNQMILVLDAISFIHIHWNAQWYLENHCQWLVMSLTLVNDLLHWPVIKWFLPCSTSDHYNHVDRIVLCGRGDEDPGYLLSAHSLLSRLRWSILYEVPAWIHICMVMAMLKFTSVWHRSMLYIW